MTESTVTCEAKWTQTGMDFTSVILTEIKCRIGMRVSWEQTLPDIKWINADSLDIVFNAHVLLKVIVGVISLWSFSQKWNFISSDKMSCEHYPKWNAYACSSKYRVILKCSRNEMSCENNLSLSLFEISIRCAESTLLHDAELPGIKFIDKHCENYWNKYKKDKFLEKSKL